MTFQFSPEQQAARDTARAFANSRISALASTIDRDARIADDLAGEVDALLSGDALARTLVTEELASVSAAVAMRAAGAKNHGQPLALSGLRGAPALDESPQTQLLLAAVALGIGRAAIDAALAELKQSKVVGASGVEKPHWVVADAATELEAARLMTYKAADTSVDADIALARLTASSAAQHAVDAALRVTGTAGLRAESTLERLARDVRAISLVMGTEEDQRAMAADALLPKSPQ